MLLKKIELYDLQELVPMISIWIPLEIVKNIYHIFADIIGFFRYKQTTILIKIIALQNKENVWFNLDFWKMGFVNFLVCLTNESRDT